MGSLPRLKPLPRQCLLGQCAPGTIVRVYGVAPVSQGCKDGRGIVVRSIGERVTVAWLDGYVVDGTSTLHSRLTVELLPEKPPLTLWDPEAPARNAAQDAAVAAMIARNS